MRSIQCPFTGSLQSYSLGVDILIFHRLILYDSVLLWALCGGFPGAFLDYLKVF